MLAINQFAIEWNSVKHTRNFTNKNVQFSNPNEYVSHFESNLKKAITYKFVFFKLNDIFLLFYNWFNDILN